MPPDVLILSSADLELQLSPSIGGAISGLSYVRDGARRPILREGHSRLQNVLEASSFPLVPFVNRIRGGSFTFRGRTVSLAPNMSGDPSPLHGQGWLNPWAVEQSDAGSAVLSYRHNPGEWPWAYSARQAFQLDGPVLDIALICRNESAEPMPCGLGQHPYFPCSPQTRIETEVRSAWTIDEQVLPVAKVPATGRYDLSGRLICGQDLDNGFEGWSRPDDRSRLAVRAGAVIASGAILPDLLARKRRLLRGGASDPRECCNERARARLARARNEDSRAG
jgi:aldose 1-epimerase